jgi:hypothetical protein
MRSGKTSAAREEVFVWCAVVFAFVAGLALGRGW